MFKLDSMGINGKFLAAVMAVYKDNKCCVRINGHHTEWFSVGRGLKQGCNLSPVLFNLFINDLVNEIKNIGVGIDIGNSKVSIMLYADDVVLLAESAEDLQCLLDALQQWCDKWKLQINETKSNVVHFRPASVARTQYAFHVKDSAIEIVDRYKYLGVLLTEFLDYNESVKVIIKCASRAFGAVVAKSKSVGGLPFNVFLKLVNSVVWPVVEYSAAVWGSKAFSSVEAFHNRISRYFLCVGRYTPSAAVRGELAVLTPSERLWKVVMKQWCRFYNLDNSRSNKQIFLWAVHEGRTKTNWCTRVQRKFGDVVNIHNNSATEMVLNSVSEALAQQVNDEWHTTVNREQAIRGQGRNKLRLYRQCKLEYGTTEPYVHMIMSRSHRSALAKFRCGVAPINIELGRYTGTPVDQRLCIVCNLQSVEDEIHTLVECPAYDNIRRELINLAIDIIPLFETLSSLNKYIILVSRSELQRSCARTCSDILLKRTQLCQR
jgi:hypothetical protein